MRLNILVWEFGEIYYFSILHSVHPRAGKHLRRESNWSRRHFLTYASTIQRNFHQEFIGLLEHATGSLALVLPLTILHLCRAKTALTDTLYFLFRVVVHGKRVIRLFCQSHWPRDLKRGFTATRFLEIRVRIPPRARKSVSSECCVFSSRGLRDRLKIRPERSYQMWCIWAWLWTLDN